LNRRVAAGLTGLLLPVVAGGCYTYSAYPLDRPQPASVVEVQLNDRGRVAMEGNVGPEVRAIEGQVVQATDSTFILSVRRVTGIDGNTSRWAGEHVSFRTENVRLIREKKLSAGRTAMFVGSLTASAMMFIAAGSLNVFGSEGDGPSGPGNGDNDN
jgi:hypothetical protein